MFEFHALFGKIAGFFAIICFVPYIVTILQKKTSPNRATWSIWLVLSFVISASYYSAGAVDTLWVPVCSLIGQSIIVFLSIKQGEGGWSRFDRMCLFGVGFSLALWWHYNSPLIALTLSLAIDFFGALPTVKKSYVDPESEDLLTWILYLITSIFNLLAVSTWSFALASFPIYMFVVNITIVTLLLRSKIPSRSNPTC
jgi:hypothetical protein